MKALKVMINAEEINIKVSQELAQAYQKTTLEEQKQIQLKIAAVIQSQIAYSYKKNLTQFRQSMDLASQQAQERGLTPEILKSVLSE